MNTKRCILISLLLVFGLVGHTFAGSPPAGAVAVYNCEQGADPNILYDSVSGWNAVWEDGEGSFIWDATDGSLDVTTDGATFAANPNLINNVGDDWSFAVWVKPVAGAGGENALLQSRNYVHTINFIARDETVRIKGPGWGGPEASVWFPDEDRDKWSHWAFVRSAAGVSIYRDGIRLGISADSAPLPPYPEDLEDGVQFAIGSEPDGSHRFRGKMDDLRFYHRALSSAEILAYVGDADMARDPSPNSSQDALSTYDEMATAATLTWIAGDSARAVDGHHVYFGTDRAAVEARDASVDQGIQTATSLPVTTELDQTYYWAVDEIADDTSVTPGMVWTFALGSYIDVDNMEAYNSDNPPDDNWPYNTWLDGFVNGTASQVGNLAQPFMERGEKHGGGQSMPFIYENSKSPNYSEMSAPVSNDNITVGSDWTVGNPTALELWFYGAEDNAPETLYQGLKSGGSGVVTGNYSGDSADISQEQWQRLIVPLADFAAGGVDLTDVQEIYFGAGNRTSPSAGGEGTLLIDTVRLYPSRTLSDLTGIELDWNEDGIVDYKELDVFSGNWRLQEMMAEPSTGVWLKLDDANTEVVDGKVVIKDSSEFGCEASISLWDGSAPSPVLWTEGKCLSEEGPGAFDFARTGNVITVTDLPDILTKAEAMTITMWMYHYVPDFAGEDNSAWKEGSWAEGLGGDHPDAWTTFAIDWDGGDCMRIWDAEDDNIWCGGTWSVDAYNNQWTHYAFVMTMEYTAWYTNGELQSFGDPFGARSGWQKEEGVGADLRTLRFGRHSKWYNDDEKDGWVPLLEDAILDDIRVYDNELTQTSIQSLMQCGDGAIDSFYVPLESIANVVPKVGDEGIVNPDNLDAVDFLDFAKFAESWRVSSPPWPY